jgi:N-acylglucosamine 2-epimerase
MNVTSLLDFYKRHVKDVLLPFWLKAVDRNHGGIYTCFNNRGDRLVSTDKYTWSQGRFLWLWSKIAEMISEDKLEGNSSSYLDQLEQTANFLEENVFLENGNCAFLLTESGQKKEPVSGKGFDTSIYADCFVVLGLTAFSKLAKDLNRFKIALELYGRIRKRIETDNIRSEPYPIPEGYRAHGISMIMLNTAQTLVDAGEALNHEKSPDLYQHSISYMQDIMKNFRLRDCRIVEMMPINSGEEDTLLYRHVNPGHTIECMWFVMDTAEKAGQDDYLQQSIAVMERAVQVGWDSEYGGILRFVDTNGGRPRGKTIGTRYEQLVSDSWDMKLWWPHSEALYVTLRSYFISGDKKMLQLYKKLEDYVFDTFPNPDKELGEWIQIRNRKGEPIDKIAALPVKDPFHILRNMLLIIDLLTEKGMKHLLNN